MENHPITTATGGSRYRMPPGKVSFLHWCNLDPSFRLPEHPHHCGATAGMLQWTSPRRVQRLPPTKPIDGVIRCGSRRGRWRKNILHQSFEALGQRGSPSRRKSRLLIEMGSAIRSSRPALGTAVTSSLTWC